MKQELRDNWTKALRSGELQQTQGTLKNSEGYCCIGVLAHILPDKIKLKFGVEETSTNISIPSDIAPGGYIYSTVPSALAKDIGLSMSVNILVDFNDRLGKDFHFIADWIEANIPVE